SARVQVCFGDGNVSRQDANYGPQGTVDAPSGLQPSPQGASPGGPEAGHLPADVELCRHPAGVAGLSLDLAVGRGQAVAAAGLLVGRRRATPGWGPTRPL